MADLFLFNVDESRAVFLLEIFIWKHKVTVVQKVRRTKNLQLYKHVTRLVMSTVKTFTCLTYVRIIFVYTNMLVNTV